MNKKEFKKIKVHITGFRLLEFCWLNEIDFPLWWNKEGYQDRFIKWVNNLPKPLRLKFFEYFKIDDKNE